MTRQHSKHPTFAGPTQQGRIVPPLPAQLLGDLASPPCRVGLFQGTDGLFDFGNGPLRRALWPRGVIPQAVQTYMRVIPRECPAHPSLWTVKGLTYLTTAHVGLLIPNGCAPIRIVLSRMTRHSSTPFTTWWSPIMPQSCLLAYCAGTSQLTRCARSAPDKRLCPVHSGQTSVPNTTCLAQCWVWGYNVGDGGIDCGRTHSSTIAEKGIARGPLTTLCSSLPCRWSRWPGRRRAARRPSPR
jgi:hypothetical protein